MTDILHFEDFAAGQVYELGQRVLDEGEMIQFAREFDPQPQHVDPQAAKDGLLGGLAASGWFLCALAMRMIVDGLFNRSTSLGAPGVEEVQWRKPAYPGDRVDMRGEVLDVRASESKPDRGLVRFRFDMVRGEERVMFFITSVMFAKRVV